MTSHDQIVRAPATPSRRVPLYHGVRSGARDMLPLDDALPAPV